MKKFLMAKLVSLLMCTTAGGLVLSPTAQLATAIAKAEGFYTRGTIPNRCANPGDLKVITGWKYPGQSGVCKGGHVHFRNDAAGWAALNHQLTKTTEGTSRYNVNMTLKQMAKLYAGNSRIWCSAVARNLGVTPDTYLFEILDVPPVLDRKSLTGPYPFATMTQVRTN
jgi:hypothetical protein